jgi:type II secretory pathway pseudopilin PulG
MQLNRTQGGFTLTELAVVFAIVALLVGGAMMTLSAQVEMRNNDETTRRLNAAADAILAFAVIYKRLPCPAIAGASEVGEEKFSSGTTAAGGTCSSYYGGFLPARSLGFQPVDASGYGVDVWGNRIRYAVSGGTPACTGTPTTPHFTSLANLKANGVSCRPPTTDLDICAPTDTSTTCSATNRVVSTQTVAFVVFSTGKNGALPATAQGAHEQANTGGTARLISRTPSGTSATNGEFDDLMVWVPASTVYAKLIAAGVLP